MRAEKAEERQAVNSRYQQVFQDAAKRGSQQIIWEFETAV
jgi:hypothetical protein